MGTVLPLASRSAVDDAWESYANHMMLAQADASLWTDRAWMEKRALLNRRFDRLFLLAERT